MTYLIGFGSHGRDVWHLWEEVQRAAGMYQLLNVRDEHNRLYTPPLDNEGGPCYFGPYYPHVRADMAERLTQYWGAEALVHPSSAPGSQCFLSPGVVIARNAVLDHNVVIGAHTHVNYSASMTRCSIGTFCTISPGAVICGDVTIGHRTFIGAGAVITNLITIGNDVLVGAGAVVVDDVPNGARVTGIPARATATGEA